jgi:hypothetical protein
MLLIKVGSHKGNVQSALINPSWLLLKRIYLQHVLMQC